MLCWYHNAVLCILLCALETKGLRCKRASPHEVVDEGNHLRKPPTLELAALVADDSADVEANRRVWMLTNLVTCAVWASLVILVSRFYQGPENGNANEDMKYAEFNTGTKAPSPSSLLLSAVSPNPEGSAGDWSFKVWKYEMSDCMDDPSVCIWSCLCPGIRWADSLNRADLLGFQTALLLFVALSAFDWLALGWGTGFMMPRLLMNPAGVVLWGLAFAVSTWGSFALLATYYRQRLRRKFHMEEQGGGSIIKDCFAHCFCVGLAIAQEARHVQAARRAGHGALAALPPLARSE